MGVVAANKAAAGSGTVVTITALVATAGNALVVGMAPFTGSNGTSTMTAARTGDTYTTDTSGVYSSGIARSGCGIASAPNVVAGPADLVITCTNAAGVSAFVVEWSGMPTSSILDATSPAVAEGSSTTATANSETNTTAHAAFFGITAVGTSANPAAMTVAGAWSDTVSPTTMTFLNGTAQEVAGFAYLEVQSVAAQQPSWTVSSAPWVAGVAVYKITTPVAYFPGVANLDVRRMIV